MSKQVDSYVASMEFDNSKFEKNVATSMSTLEKLKQKLNFSGASKGLEEINAAAGKVNMSGLGSGVDAVKAKFSALDVVAVTALANITNKAVDAGEKLIKSLSIDQLTAGWQKFSDKTTSAATLVAQGNAIEDVNAQLDRLNWFTDETSYNFTEMVANIAKFTATGKGLEESVTAMEGIATWAALSGQNAATASRAMYQLSQAMGAGVMRLEDYKSIQNASMDTEEFRQKCIDAAISLGTLKDNGDGTYKSLVKGASDTSFNISQFTKNLTDGMWLTSDVMMQVFTTYSSAVEDIYAAAEASGKTASAVIDEIYETAEKKGISTDEAIKSLGYSFDSFALKAFEAAQEARTFSDAIDSVKDAVSTGWMNTFELIFGDADQATKVWTEVANQLYDIFAGGAEHRNSILEDVMVSKWDKILEKVTEVGAEASDFEEKLKECAKAGGVDVDKMVKQYGSLGEAFRAGAIDSKYLKEAFEKLKSSADTATKSLSADLDTIERQLGFGSVGDDVKEVQTALEELGFSLDKFGVDGIIGDETTKAIKDFQESVGLVADGIIGPETLKALKEAGSAIDGIGEASENSEASIDDLVDSITRPSGQELIFDTISNSLSAVSKVVETFREAWGEIFTDTRMTNGLYNALAAIQKASETLVNFLDAKADKLKSTFKGVIAILDILTSIVGGALTAAFQILGAVFGSTNTSILDITGSVGDAIVWFRNWLAENKLITKGFNKLVAAAKKVINIVKRWVKAFKDIPFVSDLLDGIQQLFSDISSDVNDGTDNVEKWVGAFDGLSVVSKILDKIGEAFSWLGSIVEESITVFGNWFEVFRQTEGVQQLVDAVSNLIDALGKLFSGEIDANEFARVLGDSFANILISLPKMAIQIGKDFIAGFANGLGDGIGEVIDNILEFCTNFISAFAEALGIHSPSTIAYDDGVNWVQGFINGITSMLGPLMSAIQPIIDFVTGVFKSFWGYITDDQGEIEWGKIFAGAITIESLLILKSFADAMDKFASAATSFSGVISGVQKVLGSVSTAITRLGKAVATDLRSDALLKMAIAIGVLAASIWVLCQIDDYDKLWNAVAIITVLAGILIGLTIAMDKLNSASVKINKSGASLDGLKTGLLQIGIALVLVAAVVKIISDIPIEQAKQGFIGLAGIAAGMIVFMAAMGAISRYSKDVSGFGGTMIKISAAMLIMVVVIKMIARMDPEDIMVGIAVMQAFALLCIEMGIANRLAGAVNNGASFTKMAIAMGLMVLVMKLIATMDPADIVVGIAVMQAFVVLLAEMAIVNRLAGKEASKFGGTIVAMSFSMLLLAGVLLVLSKMDESAVDKGILTMQKFVLLIAEMILVSKLAGKESAKIAGNLLAMSVAIGILAGVVVLLGMCEGVDMAKGLAVVAGLGAIMAAMIWATRGASNCKANLITMTTAIAVMAAAVVALSFIDGSKLAGATAAIGSLMLMFGLMTKLASGASASVGSLIVMIGVVAILAGLLVLLGSLEIDSTLEIAASISMLMLALSASLALITAVGPLASTAFAGIGIMMLVLAGVAVVIGVLCNIPNIDSALTVATALSTLLLALSAACLVIAVGAAIMTVAGAGIGIMIGVIVAMGALMAAIAALVTWIPDLEAFLGKALPILRLVGQGIGEFLGGIVLGIGTAVLQLLPQLGMALSAFMVGVQPFITLASNVDASVVAGAGYLTAAILAITVADFIAGITQILNGGLSFAELGHQLLIFGTGAMAFFSVIQGIDSSAIEAANNIAGMILALTASELISTITEKFGGSTDFSTLGQNLQTFGEAVVGFSDTISGKIDVAAVEAATNAGLLLVELNKSLPRSGGWIQDIIGEQDFGKFAESCKAFANCILDINEVVSQEGFELQSEKIEQLVAAGTQFSELNSALPRSGGIAQDLAGEQDLAAFGVACVAFANCMIMISQAVSGEDFVVQSDKIAQLATAGTQFNELNTALPKTGGIAQDFAGEQDLARFGAAVAAFAACMILVNQAISQEGFSVNLDGIEQLKQAGLKMNELQEALPKTGGWWETIAGSKDIGDFGKKIKSFADAIVDFSTSSEGLNQEAISSCLSTVRRIKNLMTSLIDMDYSGVDAFTGIGSGGFGADGPAYDIACAIAKFGDKVADIDTEAVSVAVTAAKQLKTLIGGLVGLDTSGIENFKPGEIGKQMKSYADKVAGIDTGTVSSSISSANRLKIFISGLTGLDTSGITNFKPESIGSALKAYGDSVSGTNIGAISSSITAANRLKNFISSLAGLNSSGVGSFKTAVDQLATVNISGLVEAFSGASAKLQSAGADMIDGLVKGMQSKLSAVTTVSTEITTSSLKAITSKVPAFATAGGNLATKLASGFSSKKGTVNTAVSSCLSSAATKIRDKYSSFYSAGSYLVTGFAQGIKDNSSKAVTQAQAMVNSVVTTVRSGLKINSPSKVFREIGSGIPEGFAQGIGMLGGEVKRSVGDMASTAIKSTRSAMTTVLEALNSDMDTQPTIRPVVDLSDVKTGVNAIGSLLAGTHSIGVQSNLNAINVAMNRKLQNGTNDDIISAINKLNDGLDGNRGDTYNFAGITYDNGDEISEAVQTLVRAAKMGRRV